MLLMLVIEHNAYDLSIMLIMLKLDYLLILLLIMEIEHLLIILLCAFLIGKFSHSSISF